GRMAQWWDEWLLRILVLASLGAQYFLVLSARVRKYHIPPWLKLLLRLAHIGSDALALFAIATLFNRQKAGPCCSYARGSRDLELLWAPILVLHLGGQVVITSYKIEDNEQWSRHILTSLSKVTVALYVFYKSWSSGDKRLLAATILLFILVIIRCFQKSQELKSSSYNALRKASTSNASVVRDRAEGGLDSFIETAGRIVKNGGGEWSYMTRVKIILGEGLLPGLPYELFCDFPCPYHDRVKSMERFWSLRGLSPYRAIEGVLSAMTSYLYTKDDSMYRHASIFVRVGAIVRSCLHLLGYGNATLITAICLVHTSSHKESYGGGDTWVSLVLLYGTFVLELVYLYVWSFYLYKFSGRILQHNLIGLFAHSRRNSRLRRIAGWLDLADGYIWHMEPSYSCQEITELVRGHIETAWKEDIVDTESYRRFNCARGEWTLAKTGYFRRVGWIIQRPFDESIILWHLATDICLEYKAMSPGDMECARRCKVISNYMMHLLVANPEMLMPGSRKSVFTTIYAELDAYLDGDKTPTPQDQSGFTQEVIEKCKSGYIPDCFVRDAWLLVQSLLDHSDDDTKIWEVIQGVWVEMICFSAGRCRGYLHAEALGTGVEYLSYVWVLLAFSGMDTFTENLQGRGGQSFDGLESCSLERMPENLQMGKGQSVGSDKFYGSLEHKEAFSERLPRRECQSADNDEPFQLERKRRRTRSF
uniref:DUF4220 domain-containing protein n=3 Tax=Aegilops tauschii subsp. strangulata TaxID=200361 RepID=A0A453DDX2_AEGTS